MFFSKNKKLSSLLFRENNLIILAFLLIIVYFINSVLVSRNIFSNHILLLFNEANQLLNGRAPYKEINILYGIGKSERKI